MDKDLEVELGKGQTNYEIVLYNQLHHHLSMVRFIITQTKLFDKYKDSCMDSLYILESSILYMLRSKHGKR